MSTPAHPPPGAGATPGAPSEPSNRHLIDCTPTEEPLNACVWYGGVVEALARQNGKEPAAHVQARIAWLYQLGEHVDFTSTDPMLMLVIGKAALSKEFRVALIGVLGDIDRVTEAAFEARQAGGG